MQWELSYAAYGYWLGHGDERLLRERFRAALHKLAAERKWGPHSQMTGLHFAVRRDIVAEAMQRDDGYAQRVPHAERFVETVSHFIPRDALALADRDHWKIDVAGRSAVYTGARS